MGKKTKSKSTIAAARTRGAYPYYLLPACLKLGQIVLNHGGDRAPIPKSVIAQGLEMSQGSSAFALLVASAKTFGVVDGNTELRLTPTGCDYFLPTSPTAKRAAELEFVGKPASYAFLIKRFDGVLLPNIEILANLLGREFGIPESWRLRVAQMFVSAVQEFDVVDQGGYLRYAAKRHVAANVGAGGESSDSISPENLEVGGAAQNRTTSALVPSKPSAPPTVSLGRTQSVPVLMTQQRDGVNTWEYGEAGGVVRLETPDPLPYTLWQRLRKYVEIIEPEKSAKEE